MPPPSHARGPRRPQPGGIQALAPRGTRRSFATRRMAGSSLAAPRSRTARNRRAACVSPQNHAPNAGPDGVAPGCAVAASRYHARRSSRACLRIRGRRCRHAGSSPRRARRSPRETRRSHRGRDPKDRPWSGRRGARATVRTTGRGFAPPAPPARQGPRDRTRPASGSGPDKPRRPPRRRRSRPRTVRLRGSPRAPDPRPPRGGRGRREAPGAGRPHPPAPRGDGRARRRSTGCGAAGSVRCARARG